MYKFFFANVRKNNVMITTTYLLLPCLGMKSVLVL
jgi:hypothetical protein